MKKYYLENGDEVKIGDMLVKISQNPWCNVTGYCHKVVVTDKTLQGLIEEGIITVKETSDDEIPMDLYFYIESIANKLGWKVDKVCNYLNTLDTLNPAAAFSVILKEIAIKLDEKYEDHIKNSPEIFVVSLLDGRIGQVNKATIKSYRNFAAFRTLDDARIACRITKSILKELFKSGK
jgi:hypothetical protein